MSPICESGHLKGLVVKVWLVGGWACALMAIAATITVVGALATQAGSALGMERPVFVTLARHALLLIVQHCGLGLRIQVLVDRNPESLVYLL